MDYQDKLINKLGKKYNIDPRVVKQVVYSPLKFTNRVVQDPADMRPVRIMYYCVFTQKPSKNKMSRMEGQVDILLENMDEVIIVMGAILHFPISTMAGAKKILIDARETKDFEKVKMIWDAWKEYTKYGRSSDQN